MLKKKFEETPVLLMPNPVKPFVIESNTSKFATGAVLQQQDDNGDWHPCRYISHPFDATQRNYEIYDRELLGIIQALETWQHYLQGSSHPTIIFSDHKNLTYFRSAQKLNRWQAHWSLFLSQFKLKLVHVPGSQMVQSDALSRHSDLCPNDETNNMDITLLPDSLFIQTIDTEMHNLVATNLMKDDIVKDVIEALKSNKTPSIKSALSDWKIDDGLLFFKSRCYIPNTPSLWK